MAEKLCDLKKKGSSTNMELGEVAYSGAPMLNSLVFPDLTIGKTYIAFMSVTSTSAQTITLSGATIIQQTSAISLNYRNIAVVFKATSSTVSVTGSSNAQSYTTVWEIE